MVNREFILAKTTGKNGQITMSEFEMDSSMLPSPIVKMFKSDRNMMKVTIEMADCSVMEFYRRRK